MGGAAVKLTRRAKEIAELVALGLTNREIAGRLFLSERTVEWHIEQILNRFGFRSRSQLAAWVGRSTQVETAGPARRVPERGNLPAQFTSFIGRDRELRSLLDALTANRLVTATGPGGTGKTRLALRLAEELQADFADGVWLCDLAPVTDARLVGDAAAQALGLQVSASDRLQAVRDHLRKRSALLVLDNCEHLLSAGAAMARDLLMACPAIRILATSRTPLGVIGEAVFRLEPMPLNDAVRLFTDRASAAVPNLRFGPLHASAIASICRRLDGVPLAIELVVPRLRVQSTDQLAASLLDTHWQARTADRHGSLDALASSSYRLMEPDQQALFRRLGVFSGWFDATDAAAIAPSNGGALPVLLGSLVEQSMLVYEQSHDGARYRLLEILRGFATERLREAGELEQAQLDHAEYMIGLVERIDLAPEEGGLARRPKVIDTMVDDVRAALRTLLKVDPPRGAWLNASMMETWMECGRVHEGFHWSELTLAANPEPNRERCWNLFWHAAAMAEIRRLEEGELSRLEEAKRWFSEAVALADSPGSEALRLETLLIRAHVHDWFLDFAGAARVRQDAIDEHRRQGNERLLARALNHNAMSLLWAGRPSEARDFARESVEIRRRMDPTEVAHAVETLAQAHTLLGELNEAQQCWIEATNRFLEMGWNSILPDCLYGLAFVAGLRGRKEVALLTHYLAERLMAEVNGSKWEPIAPAETALIERLEAAAGSLVAERLRAESRTLQPADAIRLAAARS